MWHDPISIDGTSHHHARHTYVLRFGDEDCREFLARLDPQALLGDEVARAADRAAARGFIAPSEDSARLEIWREHTLLPGNKTLQELEIPTFAVLDIRPAVPKLPIALETQCDSGTRSLRLTIDRRLPLRESLGDAVAQLSDHDRFHGRRLRRFHLFNGSERLSEEDSADTAGLAEHAVLTLRPRIWFEWPPGLFWPPGPYTTYCLGALLLAAILLLIWQPWRPPPRTAFSLELRSEEPCKVQLLKAGSFVDISLPMEIDTGHYQLRILPRGYPILDTILHICPRSNKDDSMVVLEPKLRQRHSGTPMIEVRISGYDQSQTPKVPLVGKRDILINGYPCEPVAHGLVLTSSMVSGTYLIKFAIPDGQFRRLLINGSPSDNHSFLTDLSEVRTNYRSSQVALTYWYALESKETSR